MSLWVGGFGGVCVLGDFFVTVETSEKDIVLEHTRFWNRAALTQHSLDCALRNTQPDSCKLPTKFHHFCFCVLLFALASSSFSPRPSVTKSHTTHAHTVRQRRRNSFMTMGCPFFHLLASKCVSGTKQVCDCTDRQNNKTTTTTKTRREQVHARAARHATHASVHTHQAARDRGKQNNKGCRVRVCWNARQDSPLNR